MSSPLLALPPELRNNIYAYVFAEPSHYNHDKWTLEHAHDRHCNSHSLLLANRQLYNEAIAFYYNLHDFKFASFLEAIKWWETIPAHLSAQVRSFQLATRSMRTDREPYIRFGREELEKWMQAYLNVAGRENNRWGEKAVVSLPIVVKIVFEAGGEVVVEVPDAKEFMMRRLCGLGTGVTP